MSSPAPKSPELSEKSKKYDRQIRLWGEHGQYLLEQAQVCLINATALGTEILKGLVLPGIGGFTIVDGHTVTEEDIGCNFFLEPTSVGQPRAQACAQLLLELNPDVRGDYVDESPDHLLHNNPDFFKAFSVVVATGLSERTLVALSQRLWELDIPFLSCRSVGFIGIARLQVREFTVVEVHPDNHPSDLRLHAPFENLIEHLQATEITSKSPWLEVLYKYLQQWREITGGDIPRNYREKEHLRQLIRSGITSADEENFEEAIKAVNSNLGGGKANSNVRKILEDDSCINITRKSSPFWVLARAVRDFETGEGNGWLPLPGVIPDMAADTKSYITLQQVYRNQASHDAEIVYRRAQQLLREVDLPPDSITERDARLFCRHAASLHLVRGSSIAEEYEKTSKGQIIGNGLETPGSLMGHYVVLRAMEKFEMDHGAMPGECQVEPDAARLRACASRLLADWSCSTPPRGDDLAHELCRYGGSEIHSVSAFLGGCVTQEVIKLITRQFKPLNNTFIYDAITSDTETFVL